MNHLPPTPRGRRRPPGPADGLRAHSDALRSHAERLRSVAADLGRRGSYADPLHAEVTLLAERCAVAAGGLTLAAAQLDAPRRSRRSRRPAGPALRRKDP
ncbi:MULTISPECIES: hypothetical protein [unclassified Streptomyces]|uniref:hypothetical protein n=1 Tax=unclassified Streptomyces TaxID=2593676 RepID=UPI002E3795F0|nr:MULTISPECIES: hypothetical protein [unclassified Streptomyces]WUC63415.1 hypothetical protein OG861_03835 [Streptomyces sp. NBC_00539]